MPYDPDYVVDEYKGFLPKVKLFVKDAFPALYERFFKQLMVWMVDRRREPEIRRYLNELTAAKPFPLFNHIEIETVNRCNNTCSFCPVNRSADTRPFRLMERSLFVSIISQLKDLGYSKNIGLFSNNEPLLDDRLPEFCRITKEALPNAYLIIMTNGLLLTVPKMEILMKYVDRLVISNYTDDLLFTKETQEIYDHCVKNGLYKGNLRIYLRRKNEILTNRAGQAKNRTALKVGLRSPCAYPFTQMIVRPDGKVSLCCNDALGLMTMGDLNTEKIIDVWNGEAFRNLRERLMRDRANVTMCGMCDGGSL